MILNDRQIEEKSIVIDGTYKVQKGEYTPIIKDGNCFNTLVTSSFGLDSQGYTFRLDAEEDVVIKSFHCHQVNSYEKFTIPKNVCAFMYGKSSFTRKGLIFSFAVVDAGYRGGIGFSVFNASDGIIVLPAKQGIAQIVFHQIEEPNKTYEGAWQGYGLEYEVLGDN